MRLTQLLRMCTGGGAAAVGKQALMQLRQATGYPMLACRQALTRCHGDAAAAQAWLDERAQTEGWAKAEKLVDRSAPQGLLAVARRGERRLALLELRCETDFVARNARFQALLSDACNCLADAAGAGPPLPGLTLVPRDRLLALPVAKATAPLADAVAALVGSVGENVQCGRALTFNAQEPDSLAVYCHAPWQGEGGAPAAEAVGGVIFGRYAAAIAYSGGSELLAYQLCQHIVGRNPARILPTGDEAVDPPNPDKEAETTLVRQEFLLDETRLVGDVLTEAAMRLTGYFRIKCAED